MLLKKYLTLKNQWVNSSYKIQKDTSVYLAKELNLNPMPELGIISEIISNLNLIQISSLNPKISFNLIPHHESDS